MLCILCDIMYYLNLEGKSIESHAIKNKVIADRWRELPDTEKATFYDRSKVSLSNLVSPECSWKEASRLLRNFEANVRVLYLKVPTVLLG